MQSSLPRCLALPGSRSDLLLLRKGGVLPEVGPLRPSEGGAEMKRLVWLVHNDRVAPEVIAKAGPLQLVAMQHSHEVPFTWEAILSVTSDPFAQALGLERHSRLGVFDSLEDAQRALLREAQTLALAWKQSLQEALGRVGTEPLTEAH